MEGGSEEDAILKAFEESLSNFKKYYFNITDKSSNQDLSIVEDIENRFRDLYKIILGILEKKGDVNQISKDDMEAYTIYRMFERNGNIFSKLFKSENGRLPETMRNRAQVILLEYRYTPGTNHVHILESERVPSSKTFVENK